MRESIFPFDNTGNQVDFIIYCKAKHDFFFLLMILSNIKYSGLRKI